MTEMNQIYKCNICGNIVVLVHPGQGQLVCCGQPMELLKEKTKEEGREKHLPVIEKTEKGIKVKVGSVPHPMEKEHHIEWIELIVNGKSYRQFLAPGDSAEVIFPFKGEKVVARQYCNLHGLWRAE